MFDRKSKGQLATVDQPPAPQVVERKRSQKYAEALDYADSLEQEIEYYKNGCAKLQSDINVLRNRVRQLEDELDASHAKTNDFMTRNAAMHAELAVATKVLLGIYDAEKKAGAVPQQEESIRQALIAVEDIITDAKHEQNAKKVHRPDPVASDAGDRKSETRLANLD